jgi:hypothetical protein
MNAKSHDQSIDNDAKIGFFHGFPRLNLPFPYPPGTALIGVSSGLSAPFQVENQFKLVGRSGQVGRFRAFKILSTNSAARRYTRNGPRVAHQCTGVLSTTSRAPLAVDASLLDL